MKFRIFLCLLCLAAAGRVNAEPGWDAWRVHQEAGELLDTGDFAGLEALAADLKKKGYDIRQREPELDGYYGGLKLADDAPLDEWPRRLKVIKQWEALYPGSLTARIAEVHWYMEYPLGSYTPPVETGTGMPAPGAEIAVSVPKPPIDCMAKAVSLLKETPAAKVDDPEYYLGWLKICVWQGSPKGEMWRYFKSGKEVARNYAPLYEEAAIYLTPNNGKNLLERVNWEKWEVSGWPGAR